MLHTPLFWQGLGQQSLGGGVVASVKTVVTGAPFWFVIPWLQVAQRV